MAKSFLTVTFLKAGETTHTFSRCFATLRAARTWARRLAAESYVKEVALYRGQQGGMLLERVSK